MRALIAAVLAAVAFVAAGCTSNEQEFVDEVRDDGPAWTELATDAELVEMGHAACEVMETQTPMEFVLYGMEDAGDDFDWEGVGVLFRIAGDALCPEHADWFEEVP